MVDNVAAAAVLDVVAHILRVVRARARLRRRPEEVAIPASRRIGYRGVVIQRMQFSKRR